MRNKISAIIIDSEDHDYSEIKSRFSEGYENEFDILIDNEGLINISLDKFRGADCIVTIGKNIDFSSFNALSFEFRKKWVHFDEYDSLDIVNAILATFQSNIERNRGENKLFSIFTCTFNTPRHFLLRLYFSLKNQTYPNWNWWILDDSLNDETIELIKDLRDPRIMVFKNISNHGSIGFNKHMIASMCDGDYLVEVDHDDELTSDCLEYLKKAFDKYQDCDFVYSYAMEEMDGNPIYYGEDFAFGLGRYESQEVNGKTYIVATTPDVNALSIRHIVGMPNHVRCWKKDFYHKIGGHNTDLSVMDDMEILIRTFLNGKLCKIPKVLYIQHEGTGKDSNGRGSTTQGKRLKEIARTGYLIKCRYDKLIHERIKELGYEDFVWVGDDENGYSKLFITDKEYPYINYILK